MTNAYDLTNSEIDNLCSDEPLISTKEIEVSPISSLLSPVKKIERCFSAFKSLLKQALLTGIDPAIYLMQADCGTGKSRAVQQVLAAWKASGFAGDGSAIIFVASFAEIDAYVIGAGLERHDYAIYAGDRIYAKYGAGVAASDLVRILFATHAMAWSRLPACANFEDADYFHFRGKPRSLRIWDEAFLPAQYASFDLNELRALPSALKGRAKSEIAILEALLPDRGELVEGATIVIPAGIAETAKTLFKPDTKMPARARQTLEGVVKLAGSTATLIGSHDNGWRYVGISRAIPSSIGPLFVLDASARVTQRYADWSRYGMDVVRLEPALLDYGPLKLHLWDKGCGKTVLRKKDERSTIFKVIADLINASPDVKFLIIIAKEFCAFDANERAIIPDDMEAMLTDPRMVAVTTWGRHLACNDHRDISNVIVVGSYSYGDGAYDAIAMAATGDTSTLGLAERRQAARDAEFTHNVLQAVSRINVRVRDGANCGAANAYLIMTDNDHRRDLLRLTFPGCSIESWLPVAIIRPKKADLVLAALLKLLTSRSIVPFKDVIDECGSEERSYLTKVVKQDRFKQRLMTNGIHISGSHFIRMSARKAA